MADETGGQIKLSGELVAKVMDLLVGHDARCAEGLVACQYLSAVQAMLVCQRVGESEARDEIITELASFMRYAVNDMSAAQGGGGRSPAPAGAPPQNASGVWKPGDA